MKRSDLNEKRYNALLISHLLLHWKFFRHINKALNPKGKEEYETS
jgi:hypothetical protein